MKATTDAYTKVVLLQHVWGCVFFIFMTFILKNTSPFASLQEDDFINFTWIKHLRLW